MKYYAVIDTNVLVSAMLKDRSVPWKIIMLVHFNVITPVLNDEILKEYKEVLLRNEFEFKEDDVEKEIDLIKSKGIVLERLQSCEEFKDPKDVVFYEIVLSARCTMDAYLVTGNMKHYPIRECRTDIGRNGATYRQHSVERGASNRKHLFQHHQPPAGSTVIGRILQTTRGV